MAQFDNQEYLKTNTSSEHITATEALRRFKERDVKETEVWERYQQAVSDFFSPFMERILKIIDDNGYAKTGKPNERDKND